ncbi:MAG: L-histidine N(alpha)-methyltransferase [Caldilineaceae bacterium]
MSMNSPLTLYDFEPDLTSVYQEILPGLQKSPKALTDRINYDEEGSKMFERICELPEYYVTRTETALLQQHIAEITDLIGKEVLLIEYGSGNSQKTRLLLDALPQMVGYIPIDISKEFLLQSATELAQRYPHLEILPVCADYDQPFELPHPRKAAARRVAFYPGSTIGNRPPQDAVNFLHRIRLACGDNGALLIGVDLKKAPHILEAAYNDGAGICATFSRSGLRWLNQELSSNFQIDQFAHKAIYNEAMGRVEIYLVSMQEQSVSLNERLIHFNAGEQIWRAYSYKYSPAEFADLAAQAGWRVQKVWIDEQQLFSVQYLTAVSG